MTIASIYRYSLGLSLGAVLSACASQSAALQPLPAGNAQAVRLAASAYQKAVAKTKPIAYFALNSAKQGSSNGMYALTLIGGAKIAKPGAILADGKKNKYLKLAKQAYATTSLNGGIPGAGSMVAWVNLSKLPSSSGSYFYISGESAGGNDFDLQFQNDNSLYFYTGSGEHTEYVTDTSSLTGQWHMVAATYVGGNSGFRNIYWDGELVAPYSGPVTDASKTAEFSIGESLVFTGRYFQGGIDAVGIWKRALKATEIAALYAAAQ